MKTPEQKQHEWQGLTIDELRMMRAQALLRREVGKVQMMQTIEGMRTRVNDNGVRGLLFNDRTIGRLKTADYMFLGWRISRLMLKMWRKK
ncbi:MAG: hypothetical protein IJ808_04695 [Muribaculaceae bacterium]|nr:hypothetical protein [Muribaculaceae bacterium]